MRVLLDTHAFLWFIDGDARLSRHARALIEDPSNERLLSVGSLWEMAIKAGLGRLDLALPFPDLVERQVERNAMVVLPVLPPHLDAVASLPHHHRDPFDRLIIAQAISEDVPVVSRDGAFAAYPLPVLWDEP